MDLLRPRPPFAAIRRANVREILSAVAFLAAGGEVDAAKRLLRAARDYIQIAFLPHATFATAIEEAEAAIALAAKALAAGKRDR